MPPRRKTLPTIVLSSALSLSIGAAGGLFTSVKVYARDVALLRQRQDRHCAIVKLEKTVMHAVALNLRLQSSATTAMLSAMCDEQPSCATSAKVTAARREIPASFDMPTIPVEDCGEEPQER